MLCGFFLSPCAHRLSGWVSGFGCPLTHQCFQNLPTSLTDEIDHRVHNWYNWVQARCPRQMMGAYIFIGKVQTRIEPIKIGKKTERGPKGSSFFTQKQVHKVEGVEIEQFREGIGNVDQQLRRDPATPWREIGGGPPSLW